MTYHNPVISGFYPDPSICKWGDTYYLVCSSFHYFPGVPLFESKDLINWEQIGHVLTKESQLSLVGAGNAGGIYAPTIRCHNGRFYMTTTHVARNHFYVWTDEIYGEWSDPIWVDQEGIDPSLYFEGDTVYFMSNGHDEHGKAAVLQCEIEIETGEKLTPVRVIWHGAGGRYLEAPHLYLIDGTYYLVASEGGTEYGHMVIYARGATPYGPFENYPKNPVLTNRNLGGYQIQGSGHGDLIQDRMGYWWMVHLAFRQIGRYQMYHHLGREVCLIPITFCEDGWFQTDTDGITPSIVQTDRLLSSFQQKKLPIYTFAQDNWQKEWNYIRNPQLENYRFSQGSLELLATDITLNDETYSPTFLGLRQREMYGSVAVTLEVDEQEAGITLYMNESHHYDFAIIHDKGEKVLVKRRRIGDMEYIQQCTRIVGGHVRLIITFTNENYFFSAQTSLEHFDFGFANVKYLSTEVADGFTGVMIGLYAQGMSETSDYTARFTAFHCEYTEGMIDGNEEKL